MPWSPNDASAKTHKANTPNKRKQWSEVANSVLARTGDDAQAVRTANGVIAKHTYTARQERAQRKRGH
jgi:hypothetical protein